MASPSAIGAERSRVSSPTRMASAALARPGPIAAAASAPVAPSGSSRGEPSGSVTVSPGTAAMLAAPSPVAAPVRLVPRLPRPRLADGDQRAVARRAEGADPLPQVPGSRRRDINQPAERRLRPERLGRDHVPDTARGRPSGAAGRGDAHPPAPQLPREVLVPVALG